MSRPDGSIAMPYATTDERPRMHIPAARTASATTIGPTMADRSLEPETQVLLEVEDVTIQYRTADAIITAVDKVSFKVFGSDRFILLGPSGCGKSTLLKTVGGFVEPVGGRISLGSRPVRGPGPDRMMVFQEFDQLLPWKTVEQNVFFPIRMAGSMGRREGLERARLFIEKVGLSKFRDAFPHTLSGGMKQRVAIARAMAMSPKILLMDEPFASLDALTRRRMQDELLELWDELRMTILFVTHSIEEAIILGSRILVMTPHPGRVRAELNAHAFAHDSLGGEEFQTLQRRISQMLFQHHLPNLPTIEDYRTPK